MSSDSVPLRDLMVAAKRSEHGLHVLADGELSQVQFADLVATLIRHAVEKFDLPPMEMFELVRRFYVSGPDKSAKVLSLDAFRKAGQ